MTGLVVDSGVVLWLLREEIEVPSEHRRRAPALLRSPALSALREAVDRGEITRTTLERLGRLLTMLIRFLGDAVLRRRAWDLADELGWALQPGGLGV
jgi:hypothetical protein